MGRRTKTTRYRCPHCDNTFQFTDFERIELDPVRWSLWRDNHKKIYVAAVACSEAEQEMMRKYGVPNEYTCTKDFELPETWRGLPLKRV